MKKLKVLIDFVRLSVGAKIVFCRNVVSRLRANGSIFENPDVSLNDCDLLINNMERTSLAAADGGHSAIVAMHAAVDAADNAFRILATYVDRKANGDETIISISGFNASKQPTAFQKPDLSAQNGSNTGSAKLVAKAVAKAGSYIWQYAKDSIPTDESGWIGGGITTQASTELTGLTVGARYYFRVAVVTPDGISDYSGIITKIIE